MIEKNRLKIAITDQIFNYFINSRDFNGLNISAIRSDNHSEKDIQDSIIELIKDKFINVISSKDSANIYINRLGFLSIEDQISYFKRVNINYDYCCYPSILYLTEHRNTSKFKLYPFNEMLALGEAQMHLQYFEWDVLDKYSEDPRFEFKFRDYEGEISSTDLLPDKEYIDIKTFGCGRDSDNKKVVAVYLRYLIRMSSANQNHWFSKMIDRSSCKVLKDYKDNTIGSCWYFPDSVYTATVKEMNNINQLTNYIWNCAFFKKDYLSEQPAEFGTIFKPTLVRYNTFLMTAEKMFPDNINSSFFKKVQIESFDDEGNSKGTIVRFREWISDINNEYVEQITAPIRKIRKLRQLPAHKIEKNQYDYSYFDNQEMIITELFNSLIFLRRLLLTHPKAVDFVIEHNNDKVILP